MDVAALAHEAESAALPPGRDEQFAGYGVMGLPFVSGHVLAMRRFPVVDRPRVHLGVAPDAVGAWTFWQDRAAEHGCARYFSAAVSTSTETEIVLDWPRPDEIRVRVPEVQLDWRSTMVATTRSRVFNAVGSVLPDAAWRSPRLLGDGAAGRHPARPRASPHGRLSQQAGLGEFLLPQQGVFALGRAFSR